MLNRAPYNTEVPQFLPSRDAPINGYITRKYPCQEHLAGTTNEFGTLTWKIQQPDPSMVWQSVKVVLPMEIEGYHKKSGIPSAAEKNNMSVIIANPSCNIALSQSPMNAFRQTSLSLNGRIFSEDNFYRDVLDTCYRGVGTQAYGDNHSLKPIVNRGIHGDDEEKMQAIVQAYTPAQDEKTPEVWQNLTAANGMLTYARTDDYAKLTVPSVNTLLEHNGPFIERARIFQDNLSFDGKTWKGEISHLLELGPFQARARKGNTAVPYIQDFHLRLNFANIPSKFDVNNTTLRTVNDEMIAAIKGRVMAPKLLEFATYANFLHKDEVVRNYLGWPAGFTFKYSAQPYLEITYTKHESGMRDSYNLRCFEHVYEKSNRFPMTAPDRSFESPKQLARVTSRLLSNPTKIYVWGEVSDEFKYTYAMGGVRRSCRLENIHLRVNQRPDVMFNPSQEECYEMFRRHTNSNLEYGSWRKSPIYVFNMVDVGQPDMYANDARITWFEWDAEVQLTELQMTEQINLKAIDKLEAIAYETEKVEEGEFNMIPGMKNTGTNLGVLDFHKRATIGNTDKDIYLSLVYKRPGGSNARHTQLTDTALLKNQILRCETNVVPLVTGADCRLGAVQGASQSLLGCIWGQVWTVESTDGLHKVGDIVSNAFYYIPESFRFKYTDDAKMLTNSLADLSFTVKVTFLPGKFATAHVIQGTIVDAFGEGGLEGKTIGENKDGNAKWAPGVCGYAVDGTGIKNGGLIDYATLPKTTEKTGGKVLWYCFGPMPNMPSDQNGYSNWMRWDQTKSKAEVRAAGGLANWGDQTQHDMPYWEYGIEALHCDYDCVWGYRDKETFATKHVIIGNDCLGAQLVFETAEGGNDKSEDYQLKVLYEYGNCQYNFSRNATPTRILPNVVPVGPSPGIPAL